MVIFGESWANFLFVRQYEWILKELPLMFELNRPLNIIHVIFNYHSWYQWCSKTTKLQDQDHLIFQDQERSGQDQDHFFYRPSNY